MTAEVRTTLDVNGNIEQDLSPEMPSLVEDEIDSEAENIVNPEEDETIWIPVDPASEILDGPAPELAPSLLSEFEDVLEEVVAEEEAASETPAITEDDLAVFGRVTTSDAIHLLRLSPLAFLQSVNAYANACRVGCYLSYNTWSDIRREEYMTLLFEQFYSYMLAVISVAQSSPSLRKKSEVQQSIYLLYVVYLAVSIAFSSDDTYDGGDIFVGMNVDIDFVGPPAFEDAEPMFVSSFSSVFDNDKKFVFGKAFYKKIKQLCMEEYDMFGCFSDIEIIEAIADDDATRVLNFVAQYRGIAENTKIEFKSSSQTLNIMARMFL